MHRLHFIRTVGGGSVLAVAAPNPHNLQPWLVDLRGPKDITLLTGRERVLPETDPFGRQILIGHGAFLKLLVVALASRSGIRAAGMVKAARLEPLRDLCWQSGKVELLTPRTMMESIKLVRVGPDEILQHRDGISINSPFVRAVSALGMFDRSTPPAEGSAGYKNAMGRFEGTAVQRWVLSGSAHRATAAASKLRQAEATCACSLQPPTSVWGCTP